MIPRHPVKFAWWPVPLAECVRQPGARRAVWRYTGERAWLRRVQVVTTLWGDTFYLPAP